MSFIIWDEVKYSVGILEIDRQHQHLFSLVNSLYEGITSGYHKLDIQNILDQLLNYCSIHFEFEENHFCSLAWYGKCKSHCSDHQFFSDAIKKFRIDYANDKVMMPMELLNFIKIWIESHIGQVDHGFKVNAK
ncbi:MAG: hemerythrin family protein [Cyclobacteriaceae bacterium]|nr:hemerythrin family protein [Cyclobacteriaceae bacterium]